MLVLIEILAGIILVTPLAQAIVEGDANPREAVEVSSGVSIFYGSSESELSSDKNNPVAGAPFVVSVWLTIRRLDNGFYLPFILSLSVVGLVSIWVAFHELRRLSCIMPSYVSRRSGFSFWKLCGALRMKYRLSFKAAEDYRAYRVLVVFRDDVRFDNPLKSKVLLLGAEGFRLLAREYAPPRSLRDISINRAKEEVAPLLAKHLYNSESDQQSEEGRTFSLVANVMLTNTIRYDTMFVQSKIYHNRLPRQWYFLFGAGDNEIESGRTMEYFRTIGYFIPDKYLVVARLGLLEYLEDIKYIEVKAEDPALRRDYDVADQCKVSIVESVALDPGRKGFVSMDDDCGVRVKQLSEGDVPSQLLQDIDPSLSSMSIGMERRNTIFPTDHGQINVSFEGF